MILYLNNDGSRWIDTDRKAMRFVLVLANGTRKVRQADYYESFGNFAATCYRYQGKRYRGLAKDWQGHETWDESAEAKVFPNNLPHIFHKLAAGPLEA